MASGAFTRICTLPSLSTRGYSDPQTLVSEGRKLSFSCAQQTLTNRSIKIAIRFILSPLRNRVSCLHRAGLITAGRTEDTLLIVRETTATRTLACPEISGHHLRPFPLIVNVNVSVLAIVQAPRIFVKSQRVAIATKSLSWSKGSRDWVGAIRPPALYSLQPFATTDKILARTYLRGLFTRCAVGSRCCGSYVPLERNPGIRNGTRRLYSR